jgi:hypothetical protein
MMNGDRFHLRRTMNISPKTIGKLLKEQSLRVPPSQRSYRWKQDHAEDLFKDMKTAIEDDSPEYFLGSVVSIDIGGDIQIYDGQQRLATTMILIAAIRNALLDLGNEKDAAITERSYLFSEKLGAAQVTPNLTLNFEDRDYFFNKILPRPSAPKEKRSTATRSKDSHARMDSVLKYAKSFIADLIKLDSPAIADERLRRWLQFIETSLRVTWVQVGDERTAFTIFETMNDRGLKLSAADLLKNFLHAMADTHRDEIIHKWSSMVSVLETVEGEEENVVEYMRCYWVTRYGHTRTRYLYDRIKEKITNKAKAISFASELETSVQDYAAIIMASHERIADRGEAVRGSILAIRTLGVTQLRPMLLSAFQKFEHGQFAKLVEMSVSWSVRFLVCGTPSGTVEGYYARIAQEIWTDKITKAEEAFLQIKSIIPKDDQFEPDFGKVVESKAKIARYYLRALQKTVDGSTPPLDLTLEHVLDKKFDTSLHSVSEDDHRDYVNRLGNLALLESEANGAIQGCAFDKKRSVLGDASTVSLTKEIALFTKWGLEEIEQRQKRLAKAALKTWPI